MLNMTTNSNIFGLKKKKQNPNTNIIQLTNKKTNMNTNKNIQTGICKKQYSLCQL